LTGLQCRLHHLPCCFHAGILLGDAIRGDTSLFTQDACVEAAWQVLEPALKAGQPVLEYEPGTWVPGVRLCRERR